MKFSPIATAHSLHKIRGCLASRKMTAARRRLPPEEDEDMIVDGLDPFLIDAELKIAPSKAIRRMLDKTQVMTNPLNLHIRKRITHCGEVTSIASVSAAILGLNVELAKATALGHDMGHPPFGHDGEKFIREATGKPFLHETMGAVIAQHIERGGKGLNLTHAVLRGFIRDAHDAALCGGAALSEEGHLVAHSDRIAYLTGDYNDIQRIRYGMSDELCSLMESLGSNQRERVNTLIAALCLESADKGRVSFSVSDTAQKFLRIRELMYEVYAVLNSSNSTTVLERIYEFILKLRLDADPVLVLALMTDQDALFLASQPVLDYSSFQQITVTELLPSLKGREIKWWEPDLNW